MKRSTLRVIVPLVIGLAVAIGYIANIEIGTLSAFGWKDIALLCPLGALETLLAEKTLVPRTLISIVVAVILALVLGRAFCGWICPVPVTRKLAGLFKKKTDKPEVAEPLMHEGTDEPDAKSRFDSRHIVLGGALLSSAIFGFPVFCLVCPVGLSFATIFLVVSLFATGDTTWAIVVVPAVLLVEVVFFRKWCSKICPLSALMSLLASVGPKTLRPYVDKHKCISCKGGHCGTCATVCEASIVPHDTSAGAPVYECTHCGACVDVCPAKALSLPLLPPKETEEN